jgi:hypothetical protein
MMRAQPAWLMPVMGTLLLFAISVIAASFMLVANGGGL